MRVPAAGRVVSVEMNMGQMIEDVKLAAAGSKSVTFYGTAGGIVPSPDMVADQVRRTARHPVSPDGHRVR
jgi:2-oxoglutarate ferredoxin oxidoreductase subunit alpha